MGQVTTTSALSGVIGADVVNLNTAGAVGTFASPDEGANITVTVSGLTIFGADFGNYSLTQPTTTANITPIPPVDNTTTNANTTSQLSAFEVPRYPLPDAGDMTTYQVNTFTPQMGGVYFYQPPTPYDMAAFDAMMFGAGDLQFLNGFISLVGHEGLLPSGLEERRRRLPGVS